MDNAAERSQGNGSETATQTAAMEPYQGVNGLMHDDGLGAAAALHGGAAHGLQRHGPQAPHGRVLGPRPLHQLVQLFVQLWTSGRHALVRTDCAGGGGLVHAVRGCGASVGVYWTDRHRHIV